MPSYIPLLILLTLALLACPARCDFGYPPAMDYTLWSDEPPAPPNPYQLDLPDILPDFLEISWLYAFDVALANGMSVHGAEQAARAEWYFCVCFFGRDSTPFIKTKKMEAAIKKAGKPK